MNDCSAHLAQRLLAVQHHSDQLEFQVLDSISPTWVLGPLRIDHRVETSAHTGQIKTVGRMATRPSQPVSGVVLRSISCKDDQRLHC